MRTKAILVCTFLLASAIGAGAATYKTLLSFDGFDYGDSPYAGLVMDQAGNLYGAAAWGQVMQGTVFQLTPSEAGWTVHVLHKFDPDASEGIGPIGGLVADEAGNVYGTTSYDNNPAGGCGSVFKLSPSGSSWTITYLHFFYYDGAEGCDPEATLSYGGGQLWGTTKGGGSSGQGTFFFLAANGDWFYSESFTGNKGNQPQGGLNPWYYGTTYSGGVNGKGNIYWLDDANRVINKHSFQANGKGGYAPMGDLLFQYRGCEQNLYGTTSAGGVGGGGAVYRFQAYCEAGRFKILHSFTSGSSGGWAPMAGLTADAAGNLYGTTSRGGLNGTSVWRSERSPDCGTVFKLSPGQNNEWTYTVLHSFDGKNWEGCHPTSGVVLDKAGNLYGTTMYGGDYGYGAVYQITP